MNPIDLHLRLRERVSASVLAQAGLRHAALNDWLRERLPGEGGTPGALMADPVFESALPYASSGQTLEQLSGHLLHPRLVQALIGMPGNDHRFMHPAYIHQLEAWRALCQSDPCSVLVSSGTGSGKTECFLVPLLDDLARQAEVQGRLSGVRALMLYPLNALIASQEERLRSWVAPFDGQIRFGLFNGLMPNALRNVDAASRVKSAPEQVHDRATLRADPPPILVTNITMLEYLTIRREDAPILQKSRGKLRWIVIDEAHSYIGSAAAEVALLLRRVLQAFDVKAADVRFVATSATIGGSSVESDRALQDFLADLSGVSRERVHVVRGKTTPVEPAALSARPAVASLAIALGKGPVRLAALADYARKASMPVEELLAALASVPDGLANGGPLLPLRAHHFLRAVPGLWSYLNPGCTASRPAGWPFGAVLFSRTDYCPHCSARALEILSCTSCGEPFLAAREHNQVLLPDRPPNEDDFAVANGAGDTEPEEPDDTASPNDAPVNDSATASFGVMLRRLIPIGPDAAPGLRVATRINPLDGRIPEHTSDGSLDVRLSPPPEQGGHSCPHCSAGPTRLRPSPLRPLRFGAPFLMLNAAPVVLESVSPAAADKRDELPAQGRQLISFTDSRQGTARFAATVETAAERGFLRSFIYHRVQAASRPPVISEARRVQLIVELH
jgi:DEAD/DEAH box helicase domain-containing protein